MILKEVSAGQIAKRAGVGRSAINGTIVGRIKSRRLRAAIASALNIPYSKLWDKKEER